MAGLPREDFPALPEAKGEQAASRSRPSVLRDLIARTAFAITAEDARYYLAGALLRAGQGRRGAWWRPTGTGCPTRTARRRSRSTEPQRVLVPRKAIHELARLLEDEDERARSSRSRTTCVFTRRRPHARLEDDRGAVPGLREGDRGDRRQEGDAGARAPGHGHPPREPALLGAQPRRQAQPRRRASSSSPPRRPTWARRASR